MAQRIPGSRTVLTSALLLLFVTGWAANHFTALLPVIERQQHLSRAAVDGAFGIYALGLLPGLLGGGSLSDRIGRRRLVLGGAVVAALGNLAILFWHDEIGIFAGRVVVGAGVGLVMSAGTAWSADHGGAAGSVLAGIALTVGFGCGPLFSGLIAQFAPAPVVLPFAVTAALSLAATVWAAGATRGAPTRTDTPLADGPTGHTSAAGALARALPMAMWVFAAATTAMVTVAGRMTYRFPGAWLPGVAATASLTAGLVAQVVARRAGWGPRAGIAGALAVAGGFALAALAGPRPAVGIFVALVLVLGVGYGLCLRSGLVDVETWSPPGSRGALTGVFWTVTYLGFGLPLALEALRRSVGLGAPLAVLAVVALLAAGVRAAQLARSAPVTAS